MKSVVASLFSALILTAGVVSARPVKKNAGMYLYQYENVLGTSMEIKINAGSAKQAAIAENAALAEIQRLSKILSGYDATSEFSQWMKTANKPVHLSKDLFAVLSLFDQWRLKTNGVIDASAEAVGQLWKQAAINKKIPTQEAINKAIAEVKQTHWTLDTANQTANHLTNTQLRLNSFAKSYIIKAATAAAMAATGINGIIVNIGGDMVIAGNLYETVLIADPKADAENDQPIDRLQIHNKAIATSGNYRRGEEINGTWYSHIVDPRTGLPATEIISASVIASSATDAGALATAFNVLTPAECVSLAEKMPGIDYLIITKNGERIESKNWKSLEIISSATIEKSSDKNEWKNELTITLELIQQQAFAKRPFVALWVADKTGASVKTIALWYNKPKWLRDLREWFRSNGSTWTADATTFSSTTSATRSPGKYTLKWDGKDDNGNVLDAGIYTVFIEVVREHGGHELLRQEIDCSKKSQQFNLKGNVEIAAVTLDYGRK